VKNVSARITLFINWKHVSHFMRRHACVFFGLVLSGTYVIVNINQTSEQLQQQLRHSALRVETYLAYLYLRLSLVSVITCKGNQNETTKL